GTITTVAGTGEWGSSGDGGPATGATFSQPTGIAVDSQGNLFIADYQNHRIRKIDADGTITTVAGTGVPGLSGDGGPATGAQLNFPIAVAVDNQGKLFIVDTFNRRIRNVSPDGTISTVPGTTDLLSPLGVAVDLQGNLFIADASHVLRVSALR